LKMFNEINKFLEMIKKEEVPLIIPNERCRECMSIAIIEMSKYNKNFINLLNHTLRVASMSVYLARKERLNAKGKEICFLAAIFHDVFKEERNHEIKGKEFAEKILKSKKYHSDVIKRLGMQLLNIIQKMHQMLLNQKFYRMQTNRIKLEQQHF